MELLGALEVDVWFITTTFCRYYEVAVVGRGDTIVYHVRYWGGSEGAFHPVDRDHSLRIPAWRQMVPEEREPRGM